MEPRSTLRSGQHVRIIECPQNHPEHVGQLGTVASLNRVAATVRVYVGSGICQATAVESVAEEMPSDRVRPSATLGSFTSAIGAPAWWFHRTLIRVREPARLRPDDA
jgi:hypothetical protein